MMKLVCLEQLEAPVICLGDNKPNLIPFIKSAILDSARDSVTYRISEQPRIGRSEDWLEHSLLVYISTRLEYKFLETRTELHNHYSLYNYFRVKETYTNNSSYNLHELSVQLALGKGPWQSK